MLVDSDDLAGTSDLATEHGVAPSTIFFWREKPGFPEPIAIVSNKPIFSRFAVREWVAEYRRAQLERELATKP